MTFRLILIAGIALGAAACTEKSPAVPDTPQDAPEARVMTEPETPVNDKDTMGSDAFIRHMHQHARQLKRLNDALAVGDLESAQLPAFWLSRHEGVSGEIEQWLPHLQNVRSAARAVEEATDLETARSAAAQIAVGCRGCHDSAGVDVEITALK